jgi:hypothetical protein
VDAGLLAGGQRLAYEPLRDAEHVRVVRAAQPPVARDEEDPDGTHVLPRAEQGELVLDLGHAGKLADRLGDPFRVRSCPNERLLRLGDARGRDQLHRASDLHRRADGTSATREVAKLCPHVG